MWDFEQDTASEETFGDVGIVFIDCLFAFQIMLIGLFIMQIIQPKGKEAEIATAKVEGGVCAELYWPDEIDIDMDLWSSFSGLQPIGYSNTHGVYMDLNRDDLGQLSDISNRNFEITCSRGLTKGEYTYNVHWFADRYYKLKEVPIELIVVVSKIKEDKRSRITDRVKTKFVMTNVGQEKTIINFVLDTDGKIIKESVNSLNKALRGISSPSP